MAKRKRVKLGLKKTLGKAGWKIDTTQLMRRIFIAAVIINVLIGIYFIFRFRFGDYPFGFSAAAIAGVWVVSFFIVLFVCWLAVYVWLDLKAFQRRVSIENVLPDYLQLTAANLRAGMTPDRALWHAVRPHFGVLAEEVQVVAKEVMTGENIGVALHRFSDKYDSEILRRSMNLLVEGMEAGGDLADVVSRVGNNIQDTKILQKEMAANIVTYVVFISAAVMVAAPILLALAQHLLATLGSVAGSIDTSASTGGMGLLAFSDVSLQPHEFQRFAILMLTVTSLFSAMIVATIQKGNIMSGVRYIPIFIVTSLVIFFISLNTLGGVLGAFI